MDLSSETIYRFDLKWKSIKWIKLSENNMFHLKLVDFQKIYLHIGFEFNQSSLVQLAQSWLFI